MGISVIDEEWDEQDKWWGIRKTGTVFFDSLIRVSTWTEADAVKAAEYNSQRWGPHEVVSPTIGPNGTV